MNDDRDAPTAALLVGILGAVGSGLLLLVSGSLARLTSVAVGTASFFLVVWAVVVWGVRYALREWRPPSGN